MRFLAMYYPKLLIYLIFLISKSFWSLSFENSCKLCSSVKVRDHVLHSYKALFSIVTILKSTKERYVK